MWLIFFTDDESSTVHGLITSEGLFEGTITTPSDEYHIEPLSRYLNSKDSKSPATYHSIVYKTSDVQDPRKGQPCASHQLHQNGLHHSQKSYSKYRRKRWLLEGEAKLPYDDSNYLHPNRSRIHFTSPFDLNQPIDEEMDMLTNRTNVDISGLIFRNVNKRATVDPKKTTCMLYLQADHHFFSKYGTEEACIEVMTRHVQRVNSIYKITGEFNKWPPLPFRQTKTNNLVLKL